jgi:chitosanase
MNISPSQKRIVERVVNAFETGSAEGNYAAISIFHDGPHDIRQITYGRSQTTEYGRLRELVAAYCTARGQFAIALRPFADKIGSAPLTDDTAFKDLLKRAGREDPVMRQAQDSFFDKAYFLPAKKWAEGLRFELPLSMLVIYDSFIHSGSILWAIRQKFNQNPPSLGGDEKAWTAAYVNARNDWLASHPRPVVQKTAYRTACLKNEIKRGNWDLGLLPITANGVKVL